ncbi:MAG: YncE family protein, partial [Pyrinomonadaceae bacterium]
MPNNHMPTRRGIIAALLPLVLLCCVAAAHAQTSVFTYQGRLTEVGAQPNGTYEMEFKLYDSLTGGTQQPQSAPVTVDLTAANGNAVQVTNGVFNVRLDFGADAFAGSERYLEIGVRHFGDTAFTTLTPRQQITSTPYSIRSSAATTADNATQLANQLSSVGTQNNPSNPVDWTQLKNVPALAATGLAAGNGISVSGSTVSNTGVLTVGALAPLSSSGGQTPVVSLSGVVPIAKGGTGSATKNFVDLSTDQTVGGTKTFSGGVTAGGLTISGKGQFNRYDPALVATLRWDKLPLDYGDFTVGSKPLGVAFDGANIWVANQDSNNVMKLRASDGALLGTFPVGVNPTAVAFDGSNIWVTNELDGTVTELRASDGANLGTLPVGQSPLAVAFDGIYLWVANWRSNSVTRIGVNDKSHLVTTFAVGSSPSAIAFDGANVWVTNQDSNNVMKLRASDGAALGTFDAPSLFGSACGPTGIAFDGTNMWVACRASNSVTKLRAGDGSPLGGYVVGSEPPLHPPTGGGL